MSKVKIIIALVVLWVQLLFILTAQEIEIDNETELHKLPNDIIPEHYHINLNLVTIEKGFFTGNCYIFFKLNAPFTNEISFHVKLPYVHIEPSSIKFGLHPNYHSTTEHTRDCIHEPIMCIYYVKSQVLKLKTFVKTFEERKYFHRVLFPSGRYILKISFNTTLHDDEDLFKAFYINKGYKM